MKKLILLLMCLLLLFAVVYADDKDTVPSESKNSMTPSIGAMPLIWYLSGALAKAGGPFISIEYSRRLASIFWLGLKLESGICFENRGTGSIQTSPIVGASLVMSFNINEELLLHVYGGYPSGLGVSIKRHTIGIELLPVPLALYISYGYRLTF